MEKEYAEYQEALKEVKALLPLFAPNRDGFITFNEDRDLKTHWGNRIIEGAVTANDTFVENLLPVLRIIAQTDQGLKPLIERAEASRDGRERWKIIAELKSRLK